MSQNHGVQDWEMVRMDSELPPSRIPGLKLTAIFIHMRLFRWHNETLMQKGFGIEMQHFSALKICSFMQRSFTVAVFVSLHYGSGQLPTAHSSFRQSRGSKND